MRFAIHEKEFQNLLNQEIIYPAYVFRPGRNDPDHELVFQLDAKWLLSMFRHGKLHPAKQGKSWTEMEINAIKDRFLNGNSTAFIAISLERSEAEVTQVLNQCGQLQAFEEENKV